MIMDVTLIPSVLSGTIDSIPSKSFAHRAFICAAFADKPSVIKCDSLSEDIKATIKCLASIGAVINENNGIFTVTPISKKEKEPVNLDCGESGSTLRFILPIISALGRNATVNGYGRLPERPLEPLKGQLKEHGAKISDSFPLGCTGLLQGGRFTLAGNVSSQFISGLLLAFPLIGEDCYIELTSPLESKPYVDITVDVMRSFGICVEEKENTYFVKGGQSYRNTEYYMVEGDWSNAAFWLTAGIFSEEGMSVKNLNTDSVQGDKEVIGILKRFGADVFCKNSVFTIRKSNFFGIEIDAADIPDLVPILAAGACGVKGTTLIYNAQRLRLKESDRLKAVSRALSDIGADIIETEDGLVIKGTGALNGGISDSFNDHRIAMMLAVASCICKNKVVIKNAQAVNKSYPGFFDDFEKLGGRISKRNEGE